jgi:hypothetical protein
MSWKWSQTSSVREEAKKMTCREEPTAGRSSKLTPSMHDELKSEVKKAQTLLGFNVMTVQLVHLVVCWKRTRTRNTRLFNDIFESCFKIERERERYLYWINSKESPLASVTTGGLAMLLLPFKVKT